MMQQMLYHVNCGHGSTCRASEFISKGRGFESLSLLHLFSKIKLEKFDYKLQPEFQSRISIV